MSYSLIATDPFDRKIKKLAKKHTSLKTDLSCIFTQLASNPTLGTPLGKECYKVRMAITLKVKANQEEQD